MPNNNLTGYIDYFRQLAVKHKDILHNPLSESGDTSNEDLRFCKWNAEEVAMGLRTKISFPALLIEMYEVTTNAESKYDIRKITRGAFTVLQSATVADMASEEAACVMSERIVYEFLQKIWQDHYGPDHDSCSTPFKSFDFNNLNIVFTGKLFDNEYGFRVEFDFAFQNSIDITKAPADGTFIA